MRKILKRILIVLLVLVVLAGGAYCYYEKNMNPRRGTVEKYEQTLALDTILSKEDAKKDLKYLMKHLQDYHPAWLDGSDDLVEAVEAQYKSEIEQFDENATVLQLWQASARVIAKLHDGHTWIGVEDDESLYIEDFTQIDEYGPPVMINEIPVERIYEKFLECESYETEAYAKQQFYHNRIVRKDSLQLYGIDTADGVTFTYRLADDLGMTYHYAFVPIEQVKGFTVSDEEEKWVSYSIDQENNLGIFTLTQCNCNQEYLEALDQFFEEVFQNNIMNIAVDLRGNGGGNSYVANEFLRYIDVDSYNSWDSDIRMGWYLKKYRNLKEKNRKKEKTFQGNLYVLTDVNTYSSAMDFAMLVKDNGIGKVIGEASGNLPDGYGDCLYFQMPKSKLTMSISFKKWYRIDRSQKGLPISPDYEVSSSDAIEKVYELIK